MHSKQVKPVVTLHVMIGRVHDATMQHHSFSLCKGGMLRERLTHLWWLTLYRMEPMRTPMMAAKMKRVPL